MASQYSDLEKAINTLVTNFHSASSDNRSTLKVDEFKNLLSSQLPTLIKSEGLVGFTENVSQSLLPYIEAWSDYTDQFELRLSQRRTLGVAPLKERNGGCR